MVGSAVDTIVPSSAASSIPRPMVENATTRARPVRKVGVGEAAGAGDVAVAVIVPPGVRSTTLPYRVIGTPG
ncbi:hypothetical protein GCM10023349_21590 [Nocardioides conyzicola]|uniref:Uncharacterized protein n=1 Tax=Nocardioides conyzicola TaxID=1651781 RepID=A0ABP8X9U2_9ACTN